MELVTPADFFKHFFTDKLYAHITEQSNLFSTQISPDHPDNLTSTDIKKYIGVCMLMSVIHLPSIRSYWSKSIGIECKKQMMSHFEKIRKVLHFNDNTNMTTRNDANHDRLYKLRPVVNHLLERFQTVPYERDLCSVKPHKQTAGYNEEALHLRLPFQMTIGKLD